MIDGPAPHLVAAVHDALVRRAQHHTDARVLAHEVVQDLAPLLSERDRAALVERVVSELAGLGALDELLADPAVHEVMVNRATEVWVDRSGHVEHVGRLPVGSADVLLERILAPLGRRLDRRSPMVDARLPDGSRVCAVIPPAAPDGATFTIRRFGSYRHTLDDFASPSVAALLAELVRSRCNVIVSGATSSGKTTLLNALAGEVPSDERIITLEDTVELALQHAHVVRLEARTETADGVPAIGLDALLRTALRLRPDRIVVGEVRGAEALVLVQSMGTGHDGCLTTVHANDCADALRRLEVLVLQSAPSWPLGAVREHIGASVDAIVHVSRGADGRRRVVEVAEVTGVDDHGPSLATIVRGDDVIAPLTRRRRSNGDQAPTVDAA